MSNYRSRIILWGWTIANLVVTLLLFFASWKLAERHLTVIPQTVLNKYSYSTFLFLGDSQMDNLIRSGYIDILPSRLQTLTQPGITVPRLIARASSSAQKQVDNIAILVGINDLRKGKESTKVAQAIKKLANTLNLRLQPDQLVLIGLLPIIEGSPFSNQVTNQQILDVNHILRVFAQKHKGISFLDPFTILGHMNQLRPVYSSDGLHLNLEGNRALTKVLLGHLGIVMNE